MNISLSRDLYKGVDGSSLSSLRCSQMVLVYEMLEELGSTNITYVEIQNEANKKKLFGQTKAESAIRTFFPLLKKIGFVIYEGSFAANKCFTDLGVQFVLACRALENVTDGTPKKDEIIARLQNIKENAQKKGLVNMSHDPEWKSHNIWIALKLLKEFRIIHWNEFLYTLHCLEKGKSISDAISEIKTNKEKIDKICFVNKNGKALPNTCYSYIRSYLEEAGLISNISPVESKLQEAEADLFYSQIDI